MTLIFPVLQKGRNDWKGLKPTTPKKYPDEFYEFHPTREVDNSVNKIIRKSTIRNINKTNPDLKKDVLERTNPLEKLTRRTKVNFDNFPSLYEFFQPETDQQLDRSARQQSNQTRLDPEFLALKTIKPVFAPASIKKKQIIKNPLERRLVKKSNQLSPDLLALKIVKPESVERQEAGQKERPTENSKVQEGPGEKYLDVRNKKSAAERKTLKFNNDVGVTDRYRNTEIKADKTKLRKSKIYQKKNTSHLLSIKNRAGTRSETKAEFSHRTHNKRNKHNAEHKSNTLNRRKGFVSGRNSGEIPPRRQTDVREYIQSNEESEAVFEFESTISVSLDSGGYLMTIILLTQVVVFGMFLYARTLNEQDAE